MKKRVNRHVAAHGRGRPINDVTARGLGWFSIGLGVTEVLMPRALARAVGIPGASGLVFLYGLREIASGLGILKAKIRRHGYGVEWPATRWIWRR